MLLNVQMHLLLMGSTPGNVLLRLRWRKWDPDSACDAQAKELLSVIPCGTVEGEMLWFKIF